MEAIREDIPSLADAAEKVIRQPRRVLMVETEPLLQEGPTKHQWGKTNLFTVIPNSGALYDIMKCSECGITGKRHGLNETINRDRQYKPKVYQYCNTAKAHLAKKESRK